MTKQKKPRYTRNAANVRIFSPRPSNQPFEQRQRHVGPGMAGTVLASNRECRLKGNGREIIPS
jgi:hypothetical protein